MAIGKTGSFATIQPIQRDYIGDAVDSVEQNDFRYRAERRLKEDAAQKAEEARQKEVEDLKGDFNPNISGYSGIDDPVYDFSMKSKEEFANLQRQLENNPNMSYSEKAEIKRKADRYNESFKYLNQFGSLLKNKVTEIEKGIKEGKYYDGDLDRIQKELKQFESGKYELLIDGNGNPKVKIYETDEEGKPVKVLKETGLGDFVNGLNPRKNFKYDDALNKITQGVEGFTKGTQTGVTVREKTTITPEIQSAANSFADYIITDPDTRSIMEEQFGVTGNDLRQKVVNDYLAKVEQKDVQKLDSGMANFYRQSAKDKKEEQFTIGNPGAITKEGIKDGVKLPENTKSFPLGNVVVKGTGGKEQRATNVFITPTGKMYLRVENSGSESSSKKVTRYTEKGEKRRKEAQAKGIEYTAEFDDIEDVTISDKYATVDMLDFGADGSKITEILAQKGINADELANDIKKRAGFTTEKKTDNTSKPRQVVQNGITYTWNESTQSYE
jgi:hypothetical protein